MGLLGIAGSPQKEIPMELLGIARSLKKEFLLSYSELPGDQQEFLWA